MFINVNVLGLKPQNMTLGCRKSLSGNIIEELAQINCGLSLRNYSFFGMGLFLFSFSISQFLMQLLLAYGNICKI